MDHAGYVFCNVDGASMGTVWHGDTDLSTEPPRPLRPAGRASWLLLLLVSGIRERGYKNKGESDDVSKSRGLVLLSTAAKLRVVAERDLGVGDVEIHVLVRKQGTICEYLAQRNHKIQKKKCYS